MVVFVFYVFVNRILARRPYSCSDRIPNQILLKSLLAPIVHVSVWIFRSLGRPYLLQSKFAEFRKTVGIPASRGDGRDHLSIPLSQILNPSTGTGEANQMLFATFCLSPSQVPQATGVLVKIIISRHTETRNNY
jgi:hypothetical protein